MKKLSEAARKVWDYVTSMEGEHITASDIADGTGLGVKQVNGVITRGFNSADPENALLERVPAEVELPDGTHKAVKFIRKTELGMKFDPDVKTEADGE